MHVAWSVIVCPACSHAMSSPPPADCDYPGHAAAAAAYRPRPPVEPQEPRD